VVHHLTENIARRKAIDAKRGDIPQNQEHDYEDISDDDTVLDLIHDLGYLSDTGERFDVDNFLSRAETDRSDQEIISSHMDTTNYEEVSSGIEDTVDENNNIDEIIVISDIEENQERAVEGSKVKTKTQMLILTFSRTVSYIDGEEVFSNAEFQQDYYEHFN